MCKRTKRGLGEKTNGILKRYVYNQLVLSTFLTSSHVDLQVACAVGYLFTNDLPGITKEEAMFISLSERKGAVIG